MYKSIIFIFILLTILTPTSAQKLGNEIQLKINDISKSTSNQEVSLVGESWPLVPSSTNKIFGINLELILIMNTTNISYVFSIGYGRLSVRDSLKTFRDIRKLNSYSLYNQEEAKVSFGILKRIKLEKKRLEFLVSSRLFSIYDFNRKSSFNSTLLTLENDFIASSSRVVDSTSEFDLGIEFNLDIIYRISKKIGVGLSISNLYYFRFINGTTNDKSILLNERMEIEDERFIKRMENDISFFDNVNFALVFSYVLNNE